MYNSTVNDQGMVILFLVKAGIGNVIASITCMMTLKNGLL
jgi:hypothetical protein